MPKSVGLAGPPTPACEKTDNVSDWEMICQDAGPAAGATMDYTFDFTVDVGQPQRNYGQVTVHGGDNTEVDVSDNTATLALCTNGCS
jgi:hypothetical protein